MTTQEFNKISKGQKVSFRNFNDLTGKEETLTGKVNGTWKSCVIISTEKGMFYTNHMNVSLL